MHNVIHIVIDRYIVDARNDTANATEAENAFDFETAVGALIKDWAGWQVRHHQHAFEQQITKRHRLPHGPVGHQTIHKPVAVIVPLLCLCCAVAAPSVVRL